ncbi:MAG: DUF4437 domain-containing protein [Planctomycetota bacterium]
MRHFTRLAMVVGIMGATAVLGAAMLQDKKQCVFVDSAKAQFKEVVKGVQRSVLFGDPDKGAYGAFTRFDPGVTHALHTHPSDVRIAVIKGAYIYKPQSGEERRVSAGCYLFIPAGEPHVSGGDPKDGALFYEEASGKFDINFIGQR